ncbi:hypothetical protein BDZ97DRAFT_2024475 [Flammula alnicola]|nr:hypothetical protein BDZ97DRAFT_2024475 [Flammula alnicola]
MAKPLPVASTGSPGSSKSTLYNSQNSAEPSYRPQHRRYRPSKPLRSTVAPSSGLLSLLASIASASTVYGSPAPPPFLCPSLDSGSVPDSTVIKRASTSQTPPLPVPDPTNFLVARHVPTRYSEESDGIWRRVGSYTLYGSTMPACTSGCAQPTPVPSPMDGQIQVGNQSDTSTSSTAYDISEDLPPGWKPMTKTAASRTTLILALSLVLAFFICFFIIGCLFWRKNIKNKHKHSDVEAKARKKRHVTNEVEVRELVVEKETKAKQKVWARATARWKANVRHSARQRRGKRTVSRQSQPNLSSLSLDNSCSRLAGSFSSPPSRSSSRRSSIVSLPDQQRDDETPVASSSPHEDSSPPTPRQPETLPSPPAYQHHGQIPPIVISRETSSKGYSGLSIPAGRVLSPRPSHSSMYTSPALTSDAQSLSPTPLHAAHVATDDKSLLARLADLASAPPVDESQSIPGSHESAQVSAPAWQDDDIEDFAPHLIPTNGQPTDGGSSSFSPMFPPPPSKERLAAAEFYDYPYSFEEMSTPDLESGPSAPPFEEGDPPVDHALLVPSAPPLLDDSEFQPGSQPSAPEWDPPPQSDPHEENVVSGQDHDRMGLDVTALSGPSSSLPCHTPSSGTSAARDSIALPGYHP